jgi:hypothetical protein
MNILQPHKLKRNTTFLQTLTRLPVRGFSYGEDSPVL